MVEVRRPAIAVPLVLSLVLLTACGGGTPKTVSSTIPRTTPSAPTSTSAPPTESTPQGFQARSVTFVSTQLGWVLGSMSCLGIPSCTPILLRTEDAGRTWSRIPAPSDGNIDQVRFADAEDGWLYGPLSTATSPDLWATHDGGFQWERPQLPNIPPGDSVSDVEAAAGKVSASFNGDPIEIATSPVHLDDWTLSQTTMAASAGPVPSEQIVLQAGVGWLIQVDRVVIGGARLNDGAWVPWSPPCSQAGGPALLAASDSTHLAVVCHEGVYTSATPLVNAYFSSDGGSTFQPAATSPPSFPPNATGIASPAPGVVIMGGNGGDLIGTFDGGTTWTVVHHQSDSAVWLQVGFTTSSQGVAIDQNGTLLMTFDGGHDWTPVDFSSARL
jgi:photosystem II stability/assembly factor-like uncharacterized protein